MLQRMEFSAALCNWAVVFVLYLLRSASELHGLQCSLSVTIFGFFFWKTSKVCSTLVQAGGRRSELSLASVHAAPTTGNARKAKFSGTRCRTVSPPRPPSGKQCDQMYQLRCLALRMRQAVVWALPLFCLTSIMCLVWAPPVSDHMLQLPRSLRLPAAPGRSLPVRCLAKTSNFKPLMLNYSTLRSAFHATCSHGCEYRCACKHAHTTCFASAAGPSSLWGMCF